MASHFKHKKSPCLISNLNIRKERHGDAEKILGVDIKVSVNMPVAFLNSLSVEQETDWGKFVHKESGELNQLGITPVFKFNREYENHRAEITIGEGDSAQAVVFEDATIKSITAEAVEGHRAQVDYTIQVTPTKEQVAALTEGLQETVKVKVEGKQADIEDSGKVDD